MLLYCQGLEAHHEGHYREMFDRIRPCMPFLNTNVLVWIRISEALIYEFYEVWFSKKNQNNFGFSGSVGVHRHLRTPV